MIQVTLSSSVVAPALVCGHCRVLVSRSSSYRRSAMKACSSKPRCGWWGWVQTISRLLNHSSCLANGTASLRLSSCAKLALNWAQPCRNRWDATLPPHSHWLLWPRKPMAKIPFWWLPPPTRLWPTRPHLPRPCNKPFARSAVAASSFWVSPPTYPKPARLRLSPKSRRPWSHGFQRFDEKPNSVTAQQYLNEGGYRWNAGMFVLKASVWLNALGASRPSAFRSNKVPVSACKSTTTGLSIGLRSKAPLKSPMVKQSCCSPKTSPPTSPWAKCTVCGAVPQGIIEVQSASYLGKDDIVRFEDYYGRTKSCQ